jgi:hypothetical protein
MGVGHRDREEADFIGSNGPKGRQTKVCPRQAKACPTKADHLGSNVETPAAS